MELKEELVGLLDVKVVEDLVSMLSKEGEVFSSLPHRFPALFLLMPSHIPLRDPPTLDN